MSDANIENRRVGLEAIAAWLGVDAARAEAALGAAPRDPALFARLRGVPPGAPERMARRLAMAVLRRLGTAGRWELTSRLKGLRRAAGYHPLADGTLPWGDLFRELQAALDADGFRWRGRAAAVCLSHDLDSREDWQELDRLLDLERARGVRSTINVLTRWDYQLDPAALLALQRAGFEIGLHGDEHDIALGYRDPREIRRRLERALSELPVEIRGFRAPALGWSEGLLGVLGELGFMHDSSLAALATSGGGVGTCFPYRFPGLGIWEVPLTLQDSTLFRDQHLTGAVALDVTRQLLRRVVDLRGVFVLNTHPSVVRQVPGYYQGVLDAVQALGDEVLVTTVAEAVAMVSSAGPAPVGGRR